MQQSNYDQPEPQVPSNPPQVLDFHERQNLRNAKYQATRVLPEALATMVGNYIEEYLQFGYRFDMSGLTHRVVTEILTMANNREAPHT